ncbi:hypothetical protein SMAC4_13870 [Sordaria macrospora]|uniref:uncharacterized protein n=1 Tax=Sordaria macrospora TaxID=5147 RepID=UPI002B2E04EF|nr:hypothetical protein SMAC4_13870 [Sordaria macrospora]
MQEPTMYECGFHGPTSFDKQEHLSHLEEDAAQIPKFYKCGRCLWMTHWLPAHRDHLRRENPCVERSRPAMYECKLHGPTSLDQEEHLSHLEEDAESTTEQLHYKCGRCGYTTTILLGHEIHLRMENSCVPLSETTMYKCIFHGATGLTREAHLIHLQACSLWLDDDE